MRAYLAFIAALAVLWTVWSVLPLPPEFNRLETGRILGFVVLEALFFLLGAAGLYLCIRGVVGFELFVSVLMHPVIVFLAVLSGPPYTPLLCMFSFALLALFGCLAWVDG